MIPARPSPWLRSLFGLHVERRLLRTFSRVFVRGLPEVERLLEERPLLAVSNHTSWWDPMFLIWLSTRRLRIDGYALMLSEFLRRLPFLGRLGGFGMDETSASDRSEALRYAISLLDRPGRIVWIFPQGRERPITERPLGFKPGAAVVAQRAPRVRVVPVAFRYEFGEREKPDLIVSFGAALAPDGGVGELTARQEEAVTLELSRIDAALRSGTLASEFEAVLSKRRSLLGRLAQRCLGFFSRYQEAT